jgi:HAD superfamily hydrolase (TIGR01490 family)
MIVSVFDCDGTLYSAQFGYGMLRYCRDHGYVGRVRAYYLSILPRYLLRRLRLIKAEALNRPVVANLARLIAGWDTEQANAIFEWVAHQYLLPSRRPRVIARLNEHLALGHRVILLTGVYQPCLQILGRYLGVSDLIGSRVEIVDGRYTGGCVLPVVTGSDKLPYLMQYCEANGLDVDWGSSYAYADSGTDGAVLQAVGTPVAVHPDAPLRSMAIENDWEVIGVE